MSEKPIRIWNQSFTHPQETGVYHRKLSAYLQGLARDGTTIDVRGMDPPSRKHRITELRCGVEVVRNAVRAEQEGYDAFIVGHFQDAALWEARASVSIPVIGLGESSMLHACLLGRTIGLITIDPLFIPIHEEQIERYGLQHRVKEVVAVKSGSADYERAFADAEVAKAVRAKYVAKILPLAERGVEVIIPAGGLPLMLLAEDKDLDTGGALILNGLAVAVKAAEMAVDLRRAVGMEPSRMSTFIKPTEAALKTLFT
jgi:allantoin racemase